jgi:hypothetical protein
LADELDDKKDELQSRNSEAQRLENALQGESKRKFKSGRGEREREREREKRERERRERSSSV